MNVNESNEQISEKPKNQRVIVDTNGVQIIPLSIVKMSDPHGNWSTHHGLVVEPNSDIEDDGYCVAVYFYREVCSSTFWGRDRIMTVSIDDWDNAYGKNDKKSETDFLFVNSLWKRSPRVVFFRPEELIVIPSWDTITLAKRLFKDRYHTIFSLSDRLPQTPGAYMCFLKDCRNPATDLALFNVWGSVYPLFVCKTCKEKIHGFCADDLPERKNPYLTPDGHRIDLAPIVQPV